MEGMRKNRLLRVLIVDDSPTDAELMAYALEDGGFSPQCVRVDSPAAVEAALGQAHWWDVITCDVRMPGLNAAHVLAQAQAAMPSVPVLVVTGLYPSEVRRELAGATATGFVSKDHLGDLPATIRSIL